MVVFFHFFLGVMPSSKLLTVIAKISLFGQTGVTLFFVLSGFLITRILLTTRSEKGFFKNFYLRRILRIFPLYYFFLILSYYIFPYIFSSSIPDFYSQLYFYLYLQNFAVTFNWPAVGPGHFWSLAVEEHFYLFWPFVVFFLNSKKIILAIFGIIIIALFFRIILLHNGYSTFYFTFTRFDSLAIGALLAFLEKKNYFKKENVYIFMIFIICSIIPNLLFWILFSGQGNFYIQVFKDLFISFFYFSIIGYVLSIKEKHFLNKILESYFFNYTGKISYGIYVYHVLAYGLIFDFFQSNYLIVNLFNSIALTYIISSISFYLIESKFLKLKKYFEYNI